MNKKGLIAFLSILLFVSVLLPSSPVREEKDGLFVFEDSLSHTVSLSSIENTVCLYGSYAELFMLSGGAVSAVTDDATTLRGIGGEGVVNVGSVKRPDGELILSLNPDFVIMSSDIEGQRALDSLLTAAGIPHAYFRLDSFSDYLRVLSVFTTLTGRPDLYREYGTEVDERIDKIKVRAGERGTSPLFLLLRAYSTGYRVKGSETMAGRVLEEMGGVNILSLHPSLLTDLSLETIVEDNPEYIFIVTMGEDGEKALSALDSLFLSNPAVSGMDAVREGRVYVLPKELFHYKPLGDMWEDAYAYVEKILL